MSLQQCKTDRQKYEKFYTEFNGFLKEGSFSLYSISLRFNAFYARV
jgi:HSP90 family molecular chaperone